jgi:hypothetical protein
VFPTAALPRSAPAARAPAKRKRAAKSSSSSARTRPAPKKKPRAKPACKYGPRDADGYCPKKPSQADLGGDSILDRPAPKKRKRQSLGQKIERQATSSVVRASQKAATRGISAVQKAGGVKAILKSPVATGVGTASLSLGATIAAAAAAGIASFMLTTAILNRIRDNKERNRQAAFEASQAFRKARTTLQQKLGRAPTQPEIKQLYNQFTVGLKDRGW